MPEGGGKNKKKQENVNGQTGTKSSTCTAAAQGFQKGCFIYLFIFPRLLLILMSLPPEWAVSTFRSLYSF